MEQFQKVKSPRPEEPQGHQHRFTAVLGEGQHSDVDAVDGLRAAVRLDSADVETKRRNSLTGATWKQI